MSDENASTLTVTEAAALSGVSEKTLRKRIARGEVEAVRETLAGGGWAWRVAVDSIETPERLEAERLEPSNRVTEAVGSHSQAQNQQKRLEVPTASNRVTEGATEVPTAHLPGVPSVVNEATLLREALTSEREQVAFLRLQLEASNRANSEISAALREALKMSNRALTEGSHTTVTEPSQSGPQVLAAEPNAAPEPPEFRGQISEADKVTPDNKGGANSGSTGRAGRRTFRHWLLNLLNG